MIQAHFIGRKITSNTQEAFTLQDSSCFGEKSGEYVEYSPIEALFLVKENKMDVYSGKKSISFSSLLVKVRKEDKKIETKLSAFSDLRKKGYIVKTALKFGAEFRVYEKGVKPGEDHARWILYTASEHESSNWHDFAAKNRVAHATKKNLLIAIVDDEGDVSYYEIRWMRP
ncbi:tRNA-intron lyase [Candidatus Pacearchaeota archaeon]|nr:tRNA-intron lyase [Candidatus Pacearchaeota archaeon]